jgi:hypothetical protein
MNILRRLPWAGVAAAAAMLVVAGSAAAATIVGTAKDDMLRGTARADTISGKAGNDKLFGLAGNDKLLGGLGNDLLVGSSGSDALQCGAGQDVAMAGPGDRVAADCEVVKGLPNPAVTIRDASVAEGNSDTTTLSFQVELSAPARQAGSVRFATADGTATAEADYEPASGTIRFKRGDTSKTIGVTIPGDTFVESNETLTVTLSNPANVNIAKATATGTITNDDVAPRSGHYAGRTSQGKALSFDVATDVKSLTNFTTTVDVSCTEVPVVLQDTPFDLTGAPIGLASDWTFGFSIPVSEAGVSGTFALHGALSTSGPASGTLQIDLAVNASGTTIHCSTGNVSWTASPA